MGGSSPTARLNAYRAQRSVLARRISSMPTTPTNEAQRGRTCAGLRRRRSLRSRHAWDQSERERSGQAKRQQSSLAGRIACGRGFLAGAARRRRAGSGRSERPTGGRMPPLPARDYPTRSRGPRARPRASRGDTRAKRLSGAESSLKQLGNLSSTTPALEEGRFHPPSVLTETARHQVYQFLSNDISGL